ncbi:MAG TPA: HNH endonuclease [Bacteroidia bacterium]|jgi:hypothetical protein|nr:HNH endonuclease [Bacteroidia bacterium]
MRLINTIDQLKKNIDRVENYLTEGDESEKTEISKFIKRGTCFIAYQIDKEIRFAPSRFLGYINNSLDKHIPSETDGRQTNKAIIDILNTKPEPNDKLEKKYFLYSNNLGIKPSENGAFGVKRKFWLLNLKTDFQSNEELTGEFPEGKIIERIHKHRERNSYVVQLAKTNFKKKHGRLFCQICKFDFEKAYGVIGKDFIEGHHTIAVSKMSANHKTRPEDIAMLCSNCHKMVHKKRPWLTMLDLQYLVKKRIN